VYNNELRAYEALLRQSLTREKSLLYTPDILLTDNVSKEQPFVAGQENLSASVSFFVTQSSMKRAHIDGSMLNSRGWVLQERVLSQRTIHFADEGAIYCESNGDIELIGSLSKSSDWDFRGLKSMTKYLIHQELSNRIPNKENSTDSDPQLNHISTKPDMSAIYRNWYKLIERYSKCALSKPSDKLPALSGIVRQMHAFTQDKYFCGIWAQRIHQCLLWLRGKEKLQRSPRGRAPSWSWASYDGAIQYPEWSSRGSDSNIKPEFSSAVVLRRQSLDRDNSIGVLDGWALLVLSGATMLRNPSCPTGQARSGTGLRFVGGREGKPNWIQPHNRELVSSETWFWSVADDRGELIG